MKWAVVSLLLAAVPAPSQAEILFGEYIGGQEPAPEDLRVFDDRIRMGARIVFSGSETLATVVEKPANIDLQMGFITSADVAAEDVRLRCRVSFVTPVNVVSEVYLDDICFQGNLGSVAGQWVPMAVPMSFRPNEKDRKGTSGVRVEVLDEISGAEQVFMPTYLWLGGK